MPSRFGAYEILYELKSGGMGAVLLGRRRGPGAFEQLVAIKTIRPEYAHTESVRAMFLDEAAILARINHPGIATVHDFGEEAGTLYMVMEYVAGIPFRDFAELRPPPAVVARAVVEACRGLHAAHEVRDLHGAQLGVVHRDISPDNLLLGFDGHVKVIDFGIALVRNRQAPVTEFGTVKGKPPYMSPEQVKNEAMDRRSDVFSLAVVLWEMLTGQPLFDGDSIYAIARAVELQAIVPPSQIAGALPLGLDAVVLNALDRDPARRTPTAAAFAEALEGVIAAAGDETLAAWAARELTGPRDEHRTWLASILAGRDAPRPIGRPTGSVTALGPAQLAKLATLPAPASAPVQHEPPPSDEPSVSTHLAADTSDSLDRPPRRSLAVPLLLAALVLLVVGGGIFLLSRRSPSSTAPAIDGAIVASADAAAVDASLVARVDAPVAPDDAPVVAEVDAPADAPADAPRVTVARDAARPPRDTAVAAAPVDAAPQATVPDAAAAFGKLTAKHRPDGSYLLVMVDGKLFANTPTFGKRIPVGTHSVDLVTPDTNQTVYSTTIQVTDGATSTVIQP